MDDATPRPEQPTRLLPRWLEEVVEPWATTIVESVDSFVEGEFQPQTFRSMPESLEVSDDLASVVIYTSRARRSQNSRSPWHTPGQDSGCNADRMLVAEEDQGPGAPHGTIREGWTSVDAANKSGFLC